MTMRRRKMRRKKSKMMRRSRSRKKRRRKKRRMKRRRGKRKMRRKILHLHKGFLSMEMGRGALGSTPLRHWEELGHQGPQRGLCPSLSRGGSPQHAPSPGAGPRSGRWYRQKSRVGARHWWDLRPRGAPTLVLLQLADLAQDGLQVHVEPVAAAEQLQEVAGAQRAARVVDELPGRGQPVRQDLELLALRGRGGTSAPERKIP